MPKPHSKIAQLFELQHSEVALVSYSNIPIFLSFKMDI